jgi:hypothetical protein
VGRGERLSCVGAEHDAEVVGVGVLDGDVRRPERIGPANDRRCLEGVTDVDLVLAAWPGHAPMMRAAVETRKGRLSFDSSERHSVGRPIEHYPRAHP